MTRLFHALPVLVVALFFTGACGTGYGDGRGKISGVVCLNPDDPTDCNDAFHFTPDFFAIEQVGERTVLDLRAKGRAEEEADILLFYLYDVDAVRARNLCEDGVELQEDGLVRPQLHLNRSYGADHYPLTVSPDSEKSVIRFDRFTLENGERIEGSFNMQLVGRPDEAARGQLSGWFRFDVHEAPPGNNVELDNW